jgi:hypothetical protein
MSDSKNSVWIFSDNITLAKQFLSSVDFPEKFELLYFDDSGMSPAEVLMLIASSSLLVCGNSTFSLAAAKIGKIKNLFVPSSFSKYDANVDTMGNEMSMQYHTDFIISERDMPGPKILLTCTTYINDDYEGGEIHFLVDGEMIKYRPHAGEILVFPSGSPLYPGDKPYFHGVTEITSGNRLIARNFLKYTADGTAEWYEGVSKYGEDEWIRICREGMKERTPLCSTPHDGMDERAYGGIPMWESPLVKQVYKK